MEDMAVMLVPNNDAMVEWWNNGGGKVIKDAYGTIENTPTSVLAELINVNMLNSLIASVPSRFKTILNDANEPMGVTRETIDKVHLGCNGVIYETNKVYAPASYSSVLFPAVIDTENLNIIKNAIDNLDYKAYLNSMVSTYSFFIPTNNGLLTYVDPVSYGKTKRSPGPAAKRIPAFLRAGRAFFILDGNPRPAAPRRGAGSGGRYAVLLAQSLA